MRKFVIRHFVISLFRYFIFLMIAMSAFAVDQLFAQTSFFITGSEFHWTRGAVPPVVQPNISKQLAENNFRPVADSNRADLVIKVKCNSYFNGETPYFFFGALDATLKVYDKRNGKLVYSNDLKRIKGGGTTQELADEKVYTNASRIIADTLTRFLYSFTTGKPVPGSMKPLEFEPLCDADKDIPELPPDRKNSYVLIIANDAYSPMQMARCFSDSMDYHARDARVFREYAIRTLGIPSSNVQMMINAKSFEMRRELIKLASYSRGVNGNADLIFYYAGYGLIDEKTLEPYFLPVDIENDDPKFIIRISDLFKMLQEDASKRISILLETSFQFDALKPKPDKSKLAKIILRYPNVPANVFFMAASGPGQKAWSDHHAGHGLFTLALLGKLKETKAKASLKELSDFIIQDVHTTSLKMKLKEQLPHALSGSSLTKDLPILKL
ncbi:MAG: caspase family protein [Bacteroidetes bacterium]|nr:caspase family protein [Bacteroidota bacterium]